MPSSISPVVSPESVRRLLLVKLSSLGDVIHALPLLESLRAGLGPDVVLAWAVRSKFSEILDGNPHLSLSYTLDGSGAAYIWRFGAKLRAEGFDTALDTQGLLVSGIVTALSGAPRRIGLDINREGNRLFLTHPVVPAGQRTHIVEKLLGFCDALGIPRQRVRAQTYLAHGARSAAESLLESVTGGPVVGCIVGASTAAKTYPVEKWCEVVRLLSDAGCRPVLLGGPGERENAAAIVQGSGGAVAADLTGRTPLRTLASVLAACRVVIGGDSGPTHLSVAVGTPVVGLYGVTDPARTGPDWGAGASITLDFAERDAPPETRRPRHPTLPDAIARIPPATIIDAARSLISQEIHSTLEREPFAGI